MKILKTIMVCVGLMAFANVAQAQTCIESLKSMQAGELKDTMLVQCIEAQKTIKPVSEISETIQNVDVDEIASLATKYATAAGIMAKEVGMATNEFIKTDAGKIATGAIIWTIFGEDLRGLIFSPIIALCIFLFWRSFNHKLIGGEYETVTKNRWFRDPVNVQVYTRRPWNQMSEGEAWWFIVGTIACGIGIVTVLVHGLM